jgi:hypothetical protein
VIIMSDPTDPLRNPNDPLRASPDVSVELFRTLGKMVSGKPTEAVINAASNLLINAIRQSSADWRTAEAAFDELFGRSKQVLKNHYDTLGRKRGIFPFDQVIRPELFDDTDFRRKQ